MRPVTALAAAEAAMPTAVASRVATIARDVVAPGRALSRVGAWAGEPVRGSAVPFPGIGGGTLNLSRICPRHVKRPCPVLHEGLDPDT